MAASPRFSFQATNRLSKAFFPCLQIGYSSNSIRMCSNHRPWSRTQPWRRDKALACRRSFFKVWDKFHMIIRVSGCSGPSTVFDIFITWTNSFSAAIHRPWFRRVNARLAMLVKVEGCSGPSTVLNPSLAQTVFLPPSTVPYSSR